MFFFSNKIDKHRLDLHPEMNQDLKNKLDITTSNIRRDASETSLCYNRSDFKPLGDKYHILEHSKLPGWILKRERKDMVSELPHYRADSHTYRVRKAAKIARLAKQHPKWNIVVPQKYLYKTKDGETLVVAEKLQGTKVTRISKEEAIGLSELIQAASMHDTNKDNFLRTLDGKLAIIDTEAVSRGQKKASKGFLSYIFGKWAINDLALHTVASHQLSKLADEDGQAALNKAERRFFWKQVAITVAKIAIPAILIAGAIAALIVLNPTLPLLIPVLIPVIAVTAFLGVRVILRTIDLVALPFIPRLAKNNVDQMLQQAEAQEMMKQTFRGF